MFVGHHDHFHLAGHDYRRRRRPEADAGDDVAARHQLRQLRIQGERQRRGRRGAGVRHPAAGDEEGADGGQHPVLRAGAVLQPARRVPLLRGGHAEHRDPLPRPRKGSVADLPDQARGSGARPCPLRALAAGGCACRRHSVRGQLRVRKARPLAALSPFLRPGCLGAASVASPFNARRPRHRRPWRRTAAWRSRRRRSRTGTGSRAGGRSR